MTDTTRAHAMKGNDVMGREPAVETWYVTSPYGELIRPVLVTKATEQSVWIGGRRRARKGSYNNYYPTWQEAKDALIAQTEAKVNSLRRQLEQANGRLGNIKGLKDTDQ